MNPSPGEGFLLCFSRRGIGWDLIVAHQPYRTYVTGTTGLFPTLIVNHSVNRKNENAKATVTAPPVYFENLANGEHPVMIRVCYNGRRKYKSTGLSCPTRLWNAAKRRCAAAIPSR